MRTIQTAIGATTVNPDLLTYAEKRQHEGYLRREETNAAIMKLASEDIPIKEIVRRTGHSRKLVRQVVRGQRTDIFRARQSSLEAWLPLLEGQWKSGCHNASELWRRLKTKGFRGRLGVVSEWARRRRRAEQASDQQLHKVPSARTIARLMTTARDQLNKTDTMMIAVIEAGVPMLVEARNLIAGFHSMIRKKVAHELEPWIADASKSLIASFANGIIRDRAAVRAAITEPWSNGQTGRRADGQTEGQITKLKLVKRQMYGRPPPSTFDRRCLKENIIESASDPLFHAETQSITSRKCSERTPNSWRRSSVTATICATAVSSAFTTARAPMRPMTGNDFLEDFVSEPDIIARIKAKSPR
ncbi:hypothetical protein X750_30435 [Mesorhizobium sp. LNJC394B00]|nr:hypothetical protein X750_30435 [Mesorhizobium sp. LNJC394B00]